MFASAVLGGMAQLALCRGWVAGLLITACFVPFSPMACAMAVVGAAVATLWPFLRQRDMRLLETGWYGVNGALCGFLVEWHFAHPLGALVLTILAAWAAALVLDLVVFALGDAPIGLPPLTLPFLAVAVVLTLAAPRLQVGLEHLLAEGEVTPAPLAWTPPAPDPERAELAAPAWKAYGEGDYIRAHRGFLSLVRESPERAEYWNGLGWSEMKLGNDEDAAASFGESLARDPANPYAQDGLGWLAHSRQDMALAAYRFAAARAVLPQWADPYDGQGWAMYGMGRYGEAGALFRQALERAPGLSDALTGLGWTHLRRGEAKAALPLFVQALSADPQSLAAGQGLGRALLARGFGAEAETIFRSLLGRAPDAIRGLADARRLMLLHGDAVTADPREWAALLDLLGWKLAAVAALVLTVIVSAPQAGLIGLAVMGLGMAVTTVLAGPASLLWIDLHLQTSVMIGLLIGRTRHHPVGARLVLAVAVGLAGVAVWVLFHRLGGWLPLISFNLAGLAGLWWSRRHADRPHASTWDV